MDWGNAMPLFKVSDVDSVEAPVLKYTGFVAGSAIVEVSADFTTDNKVMDGGGGGVLVTRLVPNIDFTVTSLFNVGTGKLDSMSLQIIRAGALNGMKDIVVSFNLTVPTPGSAAVLGLAGVFAARRRRSVR